MKYLLITFLLLFSISTTAQLVKEHTHIGVDDATVWRFSNAGTKSVWTLDVGFGVPNIRVYNLNYSIYTTLPTAGRIVGSPSQFLYNSDSLIEFFVEEIFDLSIKNGSRLKVINENGMVLQVIDSIDFAAAPRNTPNGVKLYIQKKNASNSFMTTEFYSLPGTLPTQLKLSPLDPHSLNVYPNPSRGYSIVEYALPKSAKEGTIVLRNLQGQEINRYRVDHSFSHLRLNFDELPVGIYLYSLEANNEIVETKKIVIQN